jgi:hypothetical protein
MKQLTLLPFLLLAAPAVAHPGHLTEHAGHSHFLALAAIAAAVFIGVISIVRAFARRRRQTAG